ncbi:MAG: RluA family pseudouridine synthase [Acidobacteria bacterium]|nr:MAG: RluA family pseudouridine synthase [Acidobacteriota bacterium]
MQAEPGRNSGGTFPEEQVVLRRFTASAEDAGRRLDLYLASRLPDLSRTRIQELIDQGRVHISERLARRAQRVMPGDIIDIEILPRPPLRAAPEEIPLDVLYEDEDVIVVNKPAGMVVHAGAGAARGTLVNALLHHFGRLSTLGGNLRPGIVHRLDRGTSGAMVVARNDVAHRLLAEQFRSRAVSKTYVALLHGRMSRDAGTIDRPISRDPQRRTRMTARLGHGRAAQTDWRVLLRLGNFSLMEAEPRTGRTHQIRAHFAAAGHPLVGDTLYGAPRQVRAGGVSLNPLGRVFLHAARLSFAHPRTGATIEVRAPLDPGLREYLKELAQAADVLPRRVDAALRRYL